MKVKQFSLVRVRSIPPILKEGHLYVSLKFLTSCHLCPCGCGSKVVTPLGRGYWNITLKLFSATLTPSIGNWTLPCRSHYFIKNNKVIWAGQMSDTEIKLNREHDSKELLHLYQK
jgi:hypothetical protein